MNEIKLVLEEDKGEHVERKKLRKAAQESNEVLAHIQTADITGTNRLVRAAAIVVTRRLGIKKKIHRAQKGTLLDKKNTEKD